jgi:hypothetical protein
MDEKVLALKMIEMISSKDTQNQQREFLKFIRNMANILEVFVEVEGSDLTGLLERLPEIERELKQHLMNIDELKKKFNID